MKKYLVRAAAVTASIMVGSFSGALLGQAPAQLAFEVATVRPAPPIQDLVQQIQSGKGKIGMTVDGARVDMGFQSLADLIRLAYNVKAYQVQGPEWMAQQRFEIQAKIPEGVPEEKVPEMLQALLADRFKLAIHREKKDLPVYALIVGKNGPKLTPASADPDAPLPDSPNTMSFPVGNDQMKIAQDGKGGTVMQGKQTGTIRTSVSASGIHLEMSKATIPALVDMFAPMVDRPVLDMTDLKGSYQVGLDLPMEELMVMAQRQMASLGLPTPGPPPGANPGEAASTPESSGILVAIEKLGLKLDARKAPLDLIVVDHLEKTPTEN